jgi:hypothetical protein
VMKIAIPKSITGPIEVERRIDESNLFYWEILDRGDQNRLIVAVNVEIEAEFIAACMNQVIDAANMPPMIKVENSSNIEAIGYNKDRKELWVTFSSKGNDALKSTYVYVEVPEQTNTDLMAADSKGKFLNATVKGTYKFRKVA